MTLTLHYRNEAHKNDFKTTETLHGDKNYLKEIVAGRENIIKAYLNGKVIDILKFMEDSK